MRVAARTTLKGREEKEIVERSRHPAITTGYQAQIAVERITGGNMHHLHTHWRKTWDKMSQGKLPRGLFWLANSAMLLFCMALPTITNHILQRVLFIAGAAIWVLWMQQHTMLEQQITRIEHVLRWRQSHGEIGALARKRLKEACTSVVKRSLIIGALVSAWLGTAVSVRPDLRLWVLLLLALWWGLLFIGWKRLVEQVLGFGEARHEHHDTGHGHHAHRHNEVHTQHAHHHHDVDALDTRALRHVTLNNVALALVQLLGGLLGGSLVQMGDALHTLSDAASYGLGWYARKLSRRQAGERMPYGYALLTPLLAACSAGMLLASCMYVLWEAEQHLTGHSHPMMEPLVTLSVGLVSVVLGVWNIRRLEQDAHQDATIRVARLHEMGDIVLSLVVVVVSVLSWLTAWGSIDVIASLLVVNYLALNAWKLAREQIGIVLREAPFDVDYCALLLQDVLTRQRLPFHLASLPLVARTSEQHISIDLALLAPRGSAEEWQRLHNAVRAVLHDHFGVEREPHISFSHRQE